MDTMKHYIWHLLITINVFDSMKLWDVSKAMNNENGYKSLINKYDNVTKTVYIAEDTKPNKVAIKKDVRQGDTISPNIFTHALEHVLK